MSLPKTSKSKRKRSMESSTPSMASVKDTQSQPTNNKDKFLTEKWKKSLKSAGQDKKKQLKNSLQKRRIPFLLLGRYRLPEKKQFKSVIHFCWYWVCLMLLIILASLSVSTRQVDGNFPVNSTEDGPVENFSNNEVITIKRYKTIAMPTSRG